MALQQVSAYCLLWDDVALQFVGFRNLTGDITYFADLAAYRPLTITEVDDNYTVVSSDAGSLIVVDSDDDKVVTFPAASTWSSTDQPITIMRKGAGLVTLASTSTFVPAESKIRNAGGTIRVFPMSSTEYAAVHDGLAGSIWEMQ